MLLEHLGVDRWRLDRISSRYGLHRTEEDGAEHGEESQRTTARDGHGREGTGVWFSAE